MTILERNLNFRNFEKISLVFYKILHPKILNVIKILFEKTFKVAFSIFIYLILKVKNMFFKIPRKRIVKPGQNFLKTLNSPVLYYLNQNTPLGLVLVRFIKN